jgi:hypothetical protein
MNNFPELTNPTLCGTVIQWVNLARPSHDDARLVCRYLFVQDGVIASTDGARMHWGKTELVNGAYDRDTFEHIGLYPHMMSLMMRVVPNHNVDYLMPLSMFTPSMDIENPNGDDPYYSYDFGGIRVNERFWSDAAISQNDVKLLYPETTGGSMYGVGHRGEFVVMPLRGKP